MHVEPAATRPRPSALALSLALCAAASAQAPPAPTDAGAVDPGPLACFSTTERKPGRGHFTDLHVVGCDGDARARLLWRNDGNARLAARLTRTRFLVQSFGEPYALLLVDAADGDEAGRGEVFVAGAPHGFVGVHGDDVLFVGDARYGKDDNFLYAKSFRDPAAAPRRLCEPRVHGVPLIAGNLALAVTAGEREVWAVSLTRASGRRVYTAPEHAMHLRVALSPGGQRLAVGCHETTSWTGHLAVVDLGTAKVLNEWDRLRVDLSMLSSFTPTLEVGFADEQHVVSSETLPTGRFAWIRRSIETGDVVEETDYGPVELYHRAPPPPAVPDADPAVPRFTVTVDGETLQLRELGAADPLATVPAKNGRGSCIVVHPDGDFAFVRPADEPRKCMLYRPDRPPLEVFDGQPFELVWLPARGDG